MVDGACARRENVAVRPGRPPPMTLSHSGDAMPHSPFRRPLVCAAVALIIAGVAGVAAAQRASGSFTLQQIMGYPYPSALVAAPTGARIAWVFDERGVRNIYVASAPDWQAHRATSYTADDGQELTNLSFTPDGNTIVYVRGG